MNCRFAPVDTRTTRVMRWLVIATLVALQHCPEEETVASP